MDSRITRFDTQSSIPQDRKPDEIVQEILEREKTPSIDVTLDLIETKIPNDLEMWNSEGIRSKKKKEFNKEKVKKDFEKLLTLFENPEEKQRVEQKVVVFFNSVLEKLNLEDKKGRDYLPVGEADRFFTTYLEKIYVTFAEVSQPIEYLDLLLDYGLIATNALKLFSSDDSEKEAWEIRMHNERVPWAVEDIVTTSAFLTEYIGASPSLESRPSQIELLAAYRQEVAGENLNNIDLMHLQHKAKYLLKFVTSLEGNPTATDRISRLVVHFLENNPQLFVDFTEKSFESFAHLIQEFGTSPEEISSLFEVIEKTIEGLSSAKMASIFFIQEIFTPLAKSIKTEKYSLAEVELYLQSASEYLLTVTTPHHSQEEQQEIRLFFRENYLSYLIKLPPSLFQAFLKAVNLKKSDVLSFQNARGALDLVLSNLLIEGFSGEQDELITERYQAIAGQSFVPDGGALRLRNNLEKNVDLNQGRSFSSGFSALENLTQQYSRYGEAFEYGKGEDYNSAYRQFRDVMEFGLEATAVNPTYMSLMYEHGLTFPLAEQTNLMIGLGIMLRALREKSLTDKGRNLGVYLQMPETAEGMRGMCTAIIRLAEIYNTSNKVERDQIESLMRYILTHQELVVPFFLHLHDTAHAGTLQSLAWITRLASADQNLEGTINEFLSQSLPSLELPETTTSVVPQLEASTEKKNNSSSLTHRVDGTTPLGLAIHIIANATNDNPAVMQQMADALPKVELRTVEDIETVTLPIMRTLATHFELDTSELQEQMFTLRKASDITQPLVENDPIAETLLMISSIFGGGPVPPMAYNPETNEIIVNERLWGGNDLDRVGEEIMHWIREKVAGPDNGNPIVQEFWGFIGRRLARQALHTEDTLAKPKDFQESIDDYVQHIFDRETYHTIDMGYQHQLYNRIVHLYGYVAASNIPLEKITPELLKLSDKEMLAFLRPYFPGKLWLWKVIGKIRLQHKVLKMRGDIVETKVEDILGPIREALAYLKLE